MNPIHASDVKRVSRIFNSGGQGTVYLASIAGTKIDVAVKQFHNARPEFFEREFSILSRLSHPNIVKLLACFPERCELVLEWADGGSLLSALRKKEESLPFSELPIAMDIGRGLRYLHGQQPEPLFHLDLKSDNVLLFRSSAGAGYCAKLADFGMSKTRSASSASAAPMVTANASTLQYVAPECTVEDTGGVLAAPLDIYACGIVFWEIVTRKIPFEGVTPSAIPMKVLMGKRPETQSPSGERLTEKWRALIEKCWHQDPLLRPSASDLVLLLEAFEQPNFVDFVRIRPKSIHLPQLQNEQTANMRAAAQAFRASINLASVAAKNALLGGVDMMAMSAEEREFITRYLAMVPNEPATSSTSLTSLNLSASERSIDSSDSTPSPVAKSSLLQGTTSVQVPIRSPEGAPALSNATLVGEVPSVAPEGFTAAFPLYQCDWIRRKMNDARVTMCVVSQKAVQKPDLSGKPLKAFDNLKAAFAYASSGSVIFICASAFVVLGSTSQLKLAGGVHVIGLPDEKTNAKPKLHLRVSEKSGIQISKENRFENLSFVSSDNSFANALVQDSPAASSTVFYNCEFVSECAAVNLIKSNARFGLCSFQGCFVGIEARHSTVFASDCDLPSGPGLVVDSVSGATVERCTFEKILTDGIYLRANTVANIRFCTFSACRAGITASRMSDLTIANCTFGDSVDIEGMEAFSVDDSNRFEAQECVFRNLNRHAVRAANCTAVVVRKCDFFRIGEAAVRMCGNGSLSVFECTMRRVGYGVLLGVENTLKAFERNRISFCSKSGVRMLRVPTRAPAPVHWFRSSNNNTFEHCKEGDFDEEEFDPSLQASATASSIEICIAYSKLICTYAYTGSIGVAQTVYNCKTCPSAKYAHTIVCEVCANDCHSGHKVEKREMQGSFYWYNMNSYH